MQLNWPYQNHVPAGPNATYHDPALLDRWAAACAYYAAEHYLFEASSLKAVIESESA